MGKLKTLLVSMPWADYQFPSLQIACLSSYARESGFEVDAQHLHLETAARLGFENYDHISSSVRNFLDTELLFCALLFPGKSKWVSAYLRSHIKDADKQLRKLRRVMVQIYKDIPWKRYGLVGFSISYEQLFASLLFAKWLKRDFPDIKIVFGGPSVTQESGVSILNCFPEIDWCVDGEGEIALVELLKHLAAGEGVAGDLVPGLVHRKAHGVRMNKRRQLQQLKGLPTPDFENYIHLYQKNGVFEKTGLMPILPLETSRGCPHNCAFCTVHACWDGYRSRPASEVAIQMQRLSERYRTNVFYFADNLMVPKHGEQLFALLQRQDRDYSLFLELRADADKAMLRAMKNAGVCHVKIGIEALSSNLLRKMNKGTRAIDNLQVLKYCEELGIEHVSNLMVGFPTESEGDIKESIRNIDFALSYRPPACIVTFALKQGSPVFQRPGKYGVNEIQDYEAFRRCLPGPISRALSLTFKDFKAHGRRADYRQFRGAYERWVALYSESRSAEQKLLSYYDCKSFLRIVDLRFGTKDMTIEGNAREFYLYCDSIRGWDEIQKRFPRCKQREIRKALNAFVKLKIMFREGNDYLSLAIPAKRCCSML